MVSGDKVQRAAWFLYEAHEARAKYEPIPDEISPRDITEAYDIQEVFHELLIPDRGPIVGYKVALTTTVMQEMVGFGHPVSGAVFASSVHRTPAITKRSDYVRLGAELPVLVRLRRFPGAPVDKEVVGDISFVVNNGSVSP